MTREQQERRESLERQLLAKRNVHDQFGEWLRERREDLGLSYRELADRMECSPAYLHDVEMGRRGVTDARLLVYASKLRVSVEELEARRCEMTADLAQWIASHPDMVAWLREMRTRTWSAYR